MTPVAGSTENASAISTSDTYLLRVVLRPLRVFLEALGPLRVVRLPPFNGIEVDHPMPPGQLHQT